MSNIIVLEFQHSRNGQRHDCQPLLDTSARRNRSAPLPSFMVTLYRSLIGADQTMRIQPRSRDL
jgi:hypothetical protein